MTKTFNKDSIIPIEGGYVVVDKEAPITEQDVVLWLEGKIWRGFKKTSDGWYLQLGSSQFRPIREFQKITCSIGKRIEGVPLIEEVDEDTEDNEWKLTDLAREIFHKYPNDVTSYHIAVKAGYDLAKAAQSKGQYSEEDVLKACELAGQRAANANNYSEAAMKDEILPFLKSLQPKRIPVSVELEVEIMRSADSFDLSVYSTDRLKITNPETNTITPIKIEYEKPN